MTDLATFLRVVGLQFIVPVGVMIAVIVIVTSNYFVAQDTKQMSVNIKDDIESIKAQVNEFITNRSAQIKVSDQRFNQTLEQFQHLTDFNKQISKNASDITDKLVALENNQTQIIRQLLNNSDK